jgi:hypothetical protein
MHAVYQMHVPYVVAVVLFVAAMVVAQVAAERR